MDMDFSKIACIVAIVIVGYMIFTTKENFADNQSKTTGGGLSKQDIDLITKFVRCSKPLAPIKDCAPIIALNSLEEVETICKSKQAPAGFKLSPKFNDRCTQFKKADVNSLIAELNKPSSKFQSVADITKALNQQFFVESCPACAACPKCPDCPVCKCSKNKRGICEVVK
jgi:hypothetical protein